MAQSMTEVLVKAIFEHPGGGGGLVLLPWDQTKDLDVLSVTLPAAAKEAEPETEVVLPSTFAAEWEAAAWPRALPRDYWNVTLDDHKLVEKIVPYGSVFPQRQALIADLLRCHNLVGQAKANHSTLTVHYQGHEHEAWQHFWRSTLGSERVQESWPSQIMMVDSVVQPPELDELHQRLEASPTTVYIERIQPSNLSRCQALASRFQHAWLVSSCHSSFPRGSLHFVGQGYPAASGSGRTLKVVTAAFLSLQQQLSVRHYRNLQRWHWLQLFPRTTRAVFVQQPVYQAWEEEQRAFWQQWQHPPELKHHCAPTSPVPEHYSAPTSPVPEQHYVAPTSPLPLPLDANPSEVWDELQI